MTEMLLQFNSLGDQVVVVGATNRMHDMDPALLRRFERKVRMRLLAELPHTVTHAYTCARIQLRTHTLTRSYTHTRIHLRTHTLAHSYTYALIRLRTHALTHAYTWYVTCAVIRTMRTCTHDHGTSVVHDVYALLTLLEVVTQVASLQTLLSLLLNVIMVYDTHQLPPTATSNR